MLINDVVRRIDAQKAREDFADGRGNTVEAGKQGRPPDNSLHEPQELFAEKHLEVQGVGMIEDNELHRQNLEKGDVCQIDTRHVESSRSAALPVGRGRGGEGSAWAFPGKEDIYVFGQPKRSGIEQEVAKLGHLERSVEDREELCLGEPRHNARKGKGDVLALSRVQEGLQNNEAHCYSKEKVSKVKEAHTVPPTVVQTNHSPSIPPPTRSETRSSPSHGRETATPSTQPYFFEDWSSRGLEETKLHQNDTVGDRRLTSNTSV
jgi:hypothetical protein